MRKIYTRLLLPLIFFASLAVWDLNGLRRILARFDDLASSKDVAHPVEAAITAAEQKFVKLLTRQSRTVEAATAEYVRRYGMDPPPNFDRWFRLAQQNDFAMVDEFDTIMDSIAPFRAIQPAQLRELLAMALNKRPHELLQYEIRDGKFSSEVDAGPSWFADSMRSFLPFDWLALVPDMTLAINVYDEPMVVIPKEKLDHFMSSSPGSVNIGHVDEPLILDLTRQDAWQSIRVGCPESDVASVPHCAPTARASIDVVANWTASRDVCAHCNVHRQEGFLLSPEHLSLTHLPVPILSQAKPSVFSDILFPSPHYRGIASHETSDPIPWEDKQAKLYWTGSATGGFATEEDWRHMQRQRLAQTLKHGESKPIVLLGQAPTGEWVPYNTTTEDIQDVVDVRITGITGQCVALACEQEREAFNIQPEEVKDPENLVHAYKFLLDIDGNSFSGRLYRLLRTNSVVLKKAIFREWHDDRLVPWMHFIPISSDGDELPEVVRYLAKTKSGDALGRKMALNSRDWAERALRHIDMQLVLLRILLELGRILND